MRYFLAATAAGKTLSEILPSPACRGELKLQPSVDLEASPAALQAMERIFQQRIEEQRQSRALVEQLNECPDEINMQNDEQPAPVSPGQEYDRQYMEEAVKPPRFRAALHDQMLAMQNLSAQEQQKYLSSAKDVEEALLQEHARQRDPTVAAVARSKPKRTRVPAAPRSHRKKVAAVN